jgi:DNA-binding NtrC family response regulator
MDLLLVEDSPTDRLMHNRLHRAFPKAQIAIADDAHRLADVLGEDNCDVVVTDYWLGWSDGLSVLQGVKEKWPRVRVIILTGNGGEEVVAEAFKSLPPQAQGLRQPR